VVYVQRVDARQSERVVTTLNGRFAGRERVREAGVAHGLTGGGIAAAAGEAERHRRGA
jgi:hypothetical protein